MTVDEFKQAYQNSPKAISIASQLKKEGEKLHLKGLIGSSAALFTNAVMHNSQGFHLIVLEDKETAAFFFNDLENLNKTASHILFFPHSYKRPYQLEEIDNANVVSRAEVLERINRGNATVVVTYPEALFEKIITKKQFAKNILEIKQGGDYSIDFINELLIEYEFEKVDFVYEPGQFAVRGGIIDVFSFSNDLPYRIEFFGTK
jgi:transcription-repair coupling factor (superfamily II helicase)